MNKFVSALINYHQLLLTFIWVITCSWFWIGDPIKSVGLSVSVLVGSMIIQGILEWMYD